MIGRYEHAATLAGEAASFIRPEILALPDDEAQGIRRRRSSCSRFELQLERLIRYKPHTLGPGEEKLLAMQSEMAGAADRVFRQLTDADLKFGMCKNEKGESVELSHASFSSFLRSPSRAVRKQAFHQYYEQFQAPRELAGRRVLQLGAEGRVLRQGPQLPERPRRRRCFTTTCRSPSTTI